MQGEVAIFAGIPGTVADARDVKANGAAIASEPILIDVGSRREVHENRATRNRPVQLEIHEMLEAGAVAVLPHRDVVIEPLTIVGGLAINRGDSTPADRWPVRRVIDQGTVEVDFRSGIRRPEIVTIATADPSPRIVRRRVPYPPEEVTEMPAARIAA